MKKNRNKEIDETAYEVFQYFKEQCREQRYGEITVTVTMHDGYPVKIEKGRSIPIRVEKYGEPCEEQENKKSQNKKSDGGADGEKSVQK